MEGRARDIDGDGCLLRSIAAADADAGLRDKFRADGVVTYSGLRGYAEKRGIKANELQAFLVREAKELRLAWWEPGVSGADKAYVLATDDEHRDVVLGMFCDKQTIKRADALETCRTKTGKELPATYGANGRCRVYLYCKAGIMTFATHPHRRLTSRDAGHGRAS
jgi:hypothetical protein